MVLSEQAYKYALTIRVVVSIIKHGSPEDLSPGRLGVVDNQALPNEKGVQQNGRPLYFSGGILSTREGWS